MNGEERGFVPWSYFCSRCGIKIDDEYDNVYGEMLCDFCYEEYLEECEEEDWEVKRDM